MFAVVESGKITSMPNGNKGITIGDLKHPASIFSLWTEAERNAIGVYTVEIDETNKKSDEYYLNTAITYSYDSSADKVKGSYGTATAKSLVDLLYTNTDKSNGDIPTGKDVGDLKQEGLKTIKKNGIEQQCHALLQPSDWRVIKEQETGSAMDSGWKTWRGNMRTKCNSMQTQIDNAANVDALAALFTYTTTDGVTSRPLGEFPVKE
tara:strand:+ start:3108 stop:3728 length:621 start_codon:yes stop_codon:yes gene_type:complete